jgi:hypothetical protein
MRLATLVALGALTACEGGLTDAAEYGCPEAIVPLCTAPGLASNVSIAVADARSRLIPSLSDRALAARLDAELEALAQALNAGNVGLARAALVESDVWVKNGLSSAIRGSDPDLTGIALALAQADLLVK